MALDQDLVVGKIRCYPNSMISIINEPCAQQDGPVRKMMAVDIDGLPEKHVDPILYIGCIQVAGDYSGQGIVSGMLDKIIEWARQLA